MNSWDKVLILLLLEKKSCFGNDFYDLVSSRVIKHSLHSFMAALCLFLLCGFHETKLFYEQICTTQIGSCSHLVKACQLSVG